MITRAVSKAASYDRLQRVQNKAARIVRYASRHSPSPASGLLLHSLHWLSVCKRIEFKIASLCFKAVKLGTLPYLKSTLQAHNPVRSLRSSSCTGGGLAQLVATLVRSTKLLYSGPG